MARSLRKPPYIAAPLLRAIRGAKSSGSRKAIRCWKRGSTIVPDMVGMTFAVHDGMRFIPVVVTEEMIGHKLGEFARTRKCGGHAGDKKGK